MTTRKKTSSPFTVANSTQSESKPLLAVAPRPPTEGKMSQERGHSQQQRLSPSVSGRNIIPKSDLPSMSKKARILPKLEVKKDALSGKKVDGGDIEKQKSGTTFVPHAPAKIGIVGSLGTTGQVKLSRRKPPPPNVSSLVDRTHEKVPRHSRPRKISTISSHVSETVSVRSDDISHTTMQDMYVSRIEQRYCGGERGGLYSPSSQSGRPDTHVTGLTGDTEVDILSVVSSATNSQLSAKSKSSAQFEEEIEQSVSGVKGPFETYSTTSAGSLRDANVKPFALQSRSFQSKSSEHSQSVFPPQTGGRSSSHSHSTTSCGILHGSSLKLNVDLTQLQQIKPASPPGGSVHSEPISSASSSCVVESDRDNKGVLDKDLLQRDSVSLSGSDSSWSLDTGRRESMSSLLGGHPPSCGSTPHHQPPLSYDHPEVDHTVRSPTYSYSIESGSRCVSETGDTVDPEGKTKEDFDDTLDSHIGTSQEKAVLGGESVGELLTDRVEGSSEQSTSGSTLDAEAEDQHTPVSSGSLNAVHRPSISIQDTFSTVEGSSKSGPSSVGDHGLTSHGAYSPTTVAVTFVDPFHHPPTESLYSSEQTTNLPSQRPSIALSSDLVQLSSCTMTPYLSMDEQNSSCPQSEYGDFPGNFEDFKDSCVTPDTANTPSVVNIEFDIKREVNTNGRQSSLHSEISDRESATPESLQPVSRESIHHHHSGVLRSRVDGIGKKESIPTTLPSSVLIYDQVVSDSEYGSTPQLRPQVIVSQDTPLYLDQVTSESEGPSCSDLNIAIAPTPDKHKTDTLQPVLEQSSSSWSTQDDIEGPVMGDSSSEGPSSVTQAGGDSPGMVESHSQLLETETVNSPIITDSPSPLHQMQDEKPVTDIQDFSTRSSSMVSDHLEERSASPVEVLMNTRSCETEADSVSSFPTALNITQDMQSDLEPSTVGPPQQLLFGTKEQRSSVSDVVHLSQNIPSSTPPLPHVTPHPHPHSPGDTPTGVITHSSHLESRGVHYRLGAGDILKEGTRYSKESLAEFLAHTEGPVTLTDLMHVKGESLFTPNRESVTEQLQGGLVSLQSAGGRFTSDKVSDNKVLLLSTSSSTHTLDSDSVKASGGRYNIHHFCSIPAMSSLLPPNLQVLSMKTHSTGEPSIRREDRKTPSSLYQPCAPSPMKDSTETHTSRVQLLMDSVKPPPKIEPSRSVDAFKPVQTTEKLPQKTQAEVNVPTSEDDSNLTIKGMQLQPEGNDLNLVWHPAPPKFSLHPTTVKRFLFPNYQGLSKEERRKVEEKPEEEDDLARRLRFATRAFKSLNDLTAPDRGGEDVVSICIPHAEQYEHLGMDDDSTESTSLSESSTKEGVSGEGDSGSTSVAQESPEEVVEAAELKQLKPPQPATSRLLSLKDLQESQLTISAPVVGVSSHSEPFEGNFESILEEVSLLRKQFLEQCSLASGTDREDISDIASTLSRVESKAQFRNSKRSSLKRSHFARPGGAGKRKTRKTKSAELRASHARRKLSQKPRLLSRSLSFPLMVQDGLDLQDDCERQDARRERHLSTPTAPDFVAFMAEQGANTNTADPHKWAMGKWDKWFDEVYAEYRAIWEEHKRGAYTIFTEQLSQMAFPKEKEVQSQQIADNQDGGGEEVDHPELENLHFFILFEAPDRVKSIQAEIESLDGSISSGPPVDTLAVQLCRRASLLRQVGKLRSSKEDLDRCLQIQPRLAAAYFQRHLLFLIQSNEKDALKDLSSVLELNDHHVLALQSKATLLHKRGELTEALELMDKAVSNAPNNSGVLMFRGLLLEEVGADERAVVDYARAAELDRKNTEGLMKQAKHYYHKGHYTAASEAFTRLLQRDPNNSDARIYRARVEGKMGNYTTSLEDLSAVIHLCPNNYEAFFLRACLLRRTHPKKALKDFSTSLLLEDSRKNVSAYLHRGILYSEMGRYEEALTDFDIVIQMDPSIACAYVNMGLVYAYKYGVPRRGITFFTRALKTDPTYLRAYLCRTEAQMELKQYREALRDLTTVIHLKPDEPSYHLMKGYVHLMLSEYDLAEEYVRVASSMSGPLGTLPVRDAAVATFLGDTTTAENILMDDVRKNPSPDKLLLLGKIYGHSGKHREAFEAVSATLKSLVPPTYTRASRSTSVSFCGNSLMHLGDYNRALSFFNRAIKLDPKNAQAYYLRSLCKLKVQGTLQALPDINRSLELDPSQHEVCLKRASMFAQQGRLKKAVFNCGKAIELQPNSARAYMYRGCYRMVMSQNADALEDFDRAAKLCPTSSVVFFNRALCQQTLGNLKQAIGDYTESLEKLREPSVKVLVNRGLVRLEVEDYTGALEDFIEAAKLTPSDPTLYQAIGLCYHNLRELDLSVEAYTKAVSLNPFYWEAFISRGNVFLEYLTEKGMKNSMKDYLRVLHTDPFNIPARVNTAYLLQMEGKLRQAWDHFSVVLLYNEGDARALEGRAIVSLQAGYLDGALSDINHALKTSRTPELLTNRGVIHEYFDDTVNAGRDYCEAVQVDPSYHLAHFNMGNLYFHHRQFDQAIDCYTKSISLHPKNESPWVNRAICRSIQGHYQDALEDLTCAADINSYAAHIYFNRGNILRTLGHYSEAEEDYTKALTLQPDNYLSKAGLQNLAALKKFID